MTDRLRRQQLNSATTTTASANSSQPKSLIGKCAESQPAASEIFQPKSALSERSEPQSTPSDSSSEEDVRMHHRLTSRSGSSGRSRSSNSTQNLLLPLHTLRQYVPCLNNSGSQKLKSE